MSAPTQFDSFAEDYDDALNQGLSATGEAKDYFARARILWVARHLRRMSFIPARVMDYGCGTGTAARFILEALQPRSLIGVDTSGKSLEVARATQPPPSTFSLNRDYQRCGEIDLAYCNGVFHHIPPSARAAEVEYIHGCLRPGGLFAFWENNPWNPGTRYVMSRIPFDRDAITLTPPEAQVLLRNAGFEVLRTDFLFFFPSWLKSLRIVEPLLSALPFGGQYQILCRKPVE